MAFVEWNESLSVNVPEIDSQHKKLLEMISAFYEGLRVDDKAALQKLLNALMDYTVFHFGFEEQYFERFGYAEAAAHKKEHRIFEDRIRDAKERFEGGRLVSSFEVTNFLKSWIIDHISRSDRKYVPCFTEHGLR